MLRVNRQVKQFQICKRKRTNLIKQSIESVQNSSWWWELFIFIIMIPLCRKIIKLLLKISHLLCYLGWSFVLLSHQILYFAYVCVSNVYWFHNLDIILMVIKIFRIGNHCGVYVPNTVLRKVWRSKSQCHRIVLTGWWHIPKRKTNTMNKCHDMLHG